MDEAVARTSLNEWRMMHAIILSAGSLVCAARCAAWARRREGGAGGGLVAAMDAVLLWLLLQYVSVAVPGVLGVLNRWTITAIAVALSALLWWVGGRGAEGGGVQQTPPHGRTERVVLWAGMSFLVGYLAALLQWQWLGAAVSDDALTYHLPAAVRWLQEGRLVLHETWYFNPANTYSPLAGSMLLTWWYAPIGNDFMARFAQVQGLALILLAVLALARALGASVTVAVLLALAAVLSRPVISQISLAKDDLLLTGFFLAAVAGTSRELLSRPSGPLRLGVALGLLLATKVTALLALPVLLLAADAPWRAGWRWRQWGVAAVILLVLAGPWYARNAWLTGNPLYPVELRVGGARILPGMFRVARSAELGDAGRVWEVMVTSYFGLQKPLAAVLPVAWVAGAVLGWRRALREAVARVCILGPPVGIGVFIAAAPFAEVRFVYPAFMLLFAGAALVCGGSGGWARRHVAGVAVGGVLLVLSLRTGLLWALPDPEAPGQRVLAQGRFVGLGVVTMVAGALLGLTGRWLSAVRPGHWLAASALALLGLLAVLYVVQDSLVNAYAQAVMIGLGQPTGYGPERAEAWHFVRNELPEEQTLAYANTYLVYPLMGFGGQRRVVYAPVRPGVRRLADLGTLSEAPVAGERLRDLVKEAMNREADREVWLANLRQRRARYLLVMKGGEAPELRMAREAGFEVVFENPAAVVFRVK